MPKRGWVAALMEPMRVHAVGLLLRGLACAAAVYLHEPARPWEVTAISASLGLGLTLPVWYLRTKRHGRLVRSLTALLLGFSGLCALLHGWHAAATLLFGIAGAA